jgi:hypothetical protein
MSVHKLPHLLPAGDFKGHLETVTTDFRDTQARVLCGF